jgi:hypothetical protein
MRENDAVRRHHPIRENPDLRFPLEQPKQEDDDCDDDAFNKLTAYAAIARHDRSRSSDFTGSHAFPTRCQLDP